MSLREEGGKTSSAPIPGLYLSQAPGWRGIAGVGWGWSQQKAETSGLPRRQKKKKKKHQKSKGPWPLPPQPPAPYEKVQNIITKWGSQRGP